MEIKAIIKVIWELENRKISTVNFIFISDENIPVSEKNLAQFLVFDTKEHSLARSESSWIDFKAEHKALFINIQTLRPHIKVVGVHTVDEKI